MGLVKIGDKVIPDRRVNGARIKLDIADWVKISITIFTTFAIIVFGYGKLVTIVNANSKTIMEQETQININAQRLAKTESEITNIKENLLYIRGKIDTLVLNIKK